MRSLRLVPLVLTALGALAVGCITTKTDSTDASGSNESTSGAEIESNASLGTRLIPASGTRFLSSTNDYNELLSMTPGNEYYFSYEDVGNLETAAETARATLKVDPTSFKSLKTLSYEAIAKGNPYGAQAYMRIAQKKKIDLDDEAYVILGVAALMLDQDSKGMRFLQEAESKNPRNILPSLNRAMHSLAKGAPREALLSLNQTLSIEPSNGVANIHAGGAYYTIRDYKMAEEKFKQALLQPSTRDVARYNIGIVHYVGHRNFSKARAHFTKLLQNEKLDPVIRTQIDGTLRNIAREEHGRQNVSTIGVF